MAVPAWVGGFIGLPYVLHGRDRFGVDCWTLIALIYREVWGREFPDFVYRDDRSEHAALLKAEADFLSRRVTPGEEIVGDVAFLTVAGFVGHVGLVVDPEGGMMLHAREGSDSCMESYRRGRWSRRVAGLRRP